MVIPTLFPHNIRVFSERILTIATTSFWLLLYSVFILNLFSDSLFEKNHERVLQNDVLLSPYSSKTHENLGRYYLPYSQEIASREYKIAQNFYKDIKPDPDTTVLGIQSSPGQIWSQIAQKKDDLEKEIRTYEQIRSIDSNYDYALIKLSSLYIALDRKIEAVTLLTELSRRKPHDLYIEELKKIL